MLVCNNDNEAPIVLMDQLLKDCDAHLSRVDEYRVLWKVLEEEALQLIQARFSAEEVCMTMILSMIIMIIVMIINNNYSNNNNNNPNRSNNSI